MPALVLENVRKDEDDDDNENETWSNDLITDYTEAIDEKLSCEIAAGEWKVPVKTVKARKGKSEPPAYARLNSDTINNSYLHGMFTRTKCTEPANCSWHECS